MSKTLAYFIALAGSTFAIPLIDDNRIIGGEDALVGSRPYMASLRLRSYHLCGGCIIAKRTVLTAAHCVDKMPHDSITVVVGTNRLTPEEGTAYQSIYFKMHEAYNPSSYRDDIALLFVDSDIEYTTLVRPIAMSAKYISGGIRVDLAGWGSTQSPSKNPDWLQALRLDTISHDECRRRFSELDLHGNVFNSSLCTESPVGKGACQGDSGGPLVADGQVVGVVSWGFPCAQGYPDVFCRISFYLDWINDNIV